jgi:3-methyladenine DNA glycosylase/8-oxoguanine DNA glycosylase
MARRRTTISVEAPFDLQLCLHGHGWIALAPHAFDEATGEFTTVLRLGERAVDAKVTQAGRTSLALELIAASALTATDARAATAQLRHMLRLDDDLTPFLARCAEDPARAWIARRGAGRLLRSASMFEDLMKLLFTTNTSWAATEAMTRNLVQALGTVAPSGQRAFPSPEQCRRDSAFFRSEVRVGYRADAARALADQFASGELTDEHFLRPMPSAELWQRLLDLRGFGPYAAGQAMRLCGHYDRLALDSWCRARLQTLAGSRRPPADRTVERRYAAWAPFQGLCLWLDLTAEWHGEQAPG